MTTLVYIENRSDITGGMDEPEHTINVKRADGAIFVVYPSQNTTVHVWEGAPLIIEEVKA